ncbi:MAG: GNAT family N-acetyltransferase [Desulfobacterales bacterium]|jgi:ribosomal protein S18 acetylase RimI-like enzyme
MVIRPSENTDANAMSRIYVQTWQDTYLSVIPCGYLFEMSVPRHEQAFINELNGKRTISFVAEDAGRVVGFVTGGYERNGNDIYSGEIFTLYVLKHFQRRGIGAKLVSALAKQLNQCSIYSMLVRVLKLNPYRRFYKKINGIYLKTERLPFAGEIMELEIYGWLNTSLIHC